MSGDKFEIPKEMRTMAEASFTQARAAFEKFMASAHDTAATLEDAYVRPRFPHAIALQTKVSALLREGLASGMPHATLLNAMQDAYRRHRPLAAEL